MNDSIRKKTLSNFVWRFMERCGAQGVAFIVSIVLARLLAPELYGTIALITVFTSILNVFVDSGMASALIQKKDADSIDFSTAFYFNVVVCIALYALMYVLAPFLANYYNDSSLTSLIRVLSLTLVISGVKNVQQAYVSRNLIFKRFFFSTLGGTIGAAIVGIYLAYAGMGVWALVAQQIFNTAVDTIILWITVKWRPTLEFSFERLKGLFSFGWKLLVSALLETIYNNASQLIIGKMYSEKDLAFYNRGKTLPNVVITNVNSSIDSVLFPVMSKAQDDIDKIKKMTRLSIKISIYIMAPLMMGLAFCAEPVINLLLTDKWIETIPYLRIFCITSMFFPIHTANLNALKAMGRSDLFLKLEIEKKIAGIIILVTTMWFGVMTMAYGLLATSLLNQIINSRPNKKLLNYGYIDQLKDIFPAILLSVAMGACVYTVTLLNFNDLITICIQVALGCIIYIGGSHILKLESYVYLKNILTQFLCKR